MTEPSTAPSPLKAATTALEALMMAQRFQVVVERVRKQVRQPKGVKPRSKWVDTDDFSVRLFEGGSIRLPNDKASELCNALTSALRMLFCPFRQRMIEQAISCTSKGASLGHSKTVQGLLQDISAIDSATYICVQTSEHERLVHMGTTAVVKLPGDGKTMNVFSAAANKALADIMLPYIDDLTDTLRKHLKQIQ